VRLLVVEDDPQIADGLSRALRRNGHVVDVLDRGLSADITLGTQDFDVVILDLGLPDMDGIDVLRRLRGREKRTPVLVLTARDELADRVRGLDLGADDYMVKPFEMDELEARIRAIARRAHAGSGGDLVAGKLCMKLAQRRILVDDAPVEFSPREFAVLEILLLRRGRVVSKAQLQEQLCAWDSALTDGAIELYVHRVRRKLEFSDVTIRTVRGFGYLLENNGRNGDA